MALSRVTCILPVLLSLRIFSFSFGLHQAPLPSAVDTISANQSLLGSQNMTSKGGKFVLGFFRPAGSSSNHYYVGIWYNKISLFTPVWVANRDIPVADPNTSELQISGDGNLVLLNQSKAIIWSTNAAISSNSTAAVILDNGNLQLRDESNSSQVFWQSFDHPTDTWLPGSKLVLNKVTNHNQHLTAWKNKADPAPGIFSLEIDPDGTNQYLILWNMSRIYWTSGVWNGQFFNFVPEMGLNYVYDTPGMNLKDIFELRYVSNDKENYFTYTVKSDIIISRLVIDHASGQVRQLTWMEKTKSWMPFWSEPKQQCSVYALCGSFGNCNEVVMPFCNCVKGFRVRSKTDWDLGDTSGGCVRNTPLQCVQNSTSNSEKDGFFMMPNARLPDNTQTLAMVGSLRDCELACLNNCSCTAYSHNATGCFVWYGELLNLQEQYNQSDASTLYLRLAASELQSSKSKKGAVTWIIVGVVAAIVACFAIIWFVVLRRRRRMISKSKAVGGYLMPFRYSELQHATKNFSEKLGEGSFGSVFKGSLPGSTAIAVKKLEGLRQGEKQFRAEVSTIGTIQHVNLVRLLGFCSQGSNKKLLVYELMPNGSLDARLFQSTTSTGLDWRTRYNIAIGTARGLAYLHEQCRDCIIHCDIKPENVLLDASFVPKVADFGLAKLMGRDFSRVLTTMRGSRGYLAPEWITGLAITAKVDVYSYGMMLFEIISGRRNFMPRGESSFDLFPVLATSKLIAGDVQSLLDPRLRGEANLEELERACKVACWCIQDDESSRPTMGRVVQVLEGLQDVGVPPLPRSLQVLTEDINFLCNLSSDRSSQICNAPSSNSQIRSTTTNSPGL